MNHRFSVRVYYEDTDAAGIVYYANYFRFMERARTEWLRDLGFEQDRLREQLGLVFVVRRVEADYLHPARFNDLLWVDSTLVERGRSSLVLDQTLSRQQDEQTLCRGRVQLVCLEIERFRPRALPEALVEKFAHGQQ